MTTQEMASEMGVSVADVESFINCLRVWTNKGYSVEMAIHKHMEQMNRMVSAVKGGVDEKLVAQLKPKIALCLYLAGEGPLTRSIIEWCEFRVWDRSITNQDSRQIGEGLRWLHNSR